MNKIIIGRNASGKTVVLEEYVKEFGGSALCANNVAPTLDSSWVYDKDTISIIEDILDGKIIQGKDYFSAESEFKLGINFYNLIRVMCRRSDYLVIDEPEFLLTETENTLIMEFLVRLMQVNRFKHIIIATNESSYLGLRGFTYNKVYTKDNAYKLMSVAEENKYEVID